MLTAEILRPAELGSRDRAAWTALREGQPLFRTPLIAPDFATAVGRVRRDAAVAVIRRSGSPVGFLAHHRRPGGFSRPIGAPFSDYHALVAEPGLDAEAALRLAGIRAFPFSGLLDPHQAFRPSGHAQSYAIELPPGATAAADYLEALRAGSAKRFKNLRRLGHKLEREVGPLRLIADDASLDRFTTLFAWKHAQFRRSGLTDVFAAGWAQALMRGLFERGEGELRGLMISLLAGERPVAIHFGVREGEYYHPWAAGHDEALSAYSPGQLFLWRVIEAMPALGLRHYDLAGGHDHYKLPFANRILSIGEGRAGEAPDRWRPVERALGPSGARLRRRMGQIAAVELTLPGRIAAFAHALATSNRRLLTAAAAEL